MIIKLSKIINCSSEHPLYPSSNLLEHPPKSSWRCSKSNMLMATVTFELAEPSCITGIEIGNYRSCIIVVEASTSKESDKWIPMVNHQFLSYDEAANSKFRDQVQLFTKRDLNPETINIKFDRVKVTCMQSANPRELFGLEFIIFKTEVTVDLGLNVFGRFKLKELNDDKTDRLKKKYLKVFENKQNYKNQLKEEMIEYGIKKFVKKQEENPIQTKNPIWKKLKSNIKSNEIQLGQSTTSNSLIPLKIKLKNEKDSIKLNKNTDGYITQSLLDDEPINKRKKKVDEKNNKDFNANSKNRFYAFQDTNSCNEKVKGNNHCSVCNIEPDKLCKKCNLLTKQSAILNYEKENSNKIRKPKKTFNKLFEDISFSLSGYVNPQRDQIRRQALKMGAKYIVNPNLTNNKCTHLICHFKNTPKYEQLKGHCKIVDRRFIEDCFNDRKRFPWRRYALDSNEKIQPESEEEIEESVSSETLTIYDQDTDSETDY